MSKIVSTVATLIACAEAAAIRSPENVAVQNGNVMGNSTLNALDNKARIAEQGKQGLAGITLAQAARVKTDARDVSLNLAVVPDVVGGDGVGGVGGDGVELRIQADTESPGCDAECSSVFHKRNLWEQPHECTNCIVNTCINVLPTPWKQQQAGAEQVEKCTSWTKWMGEKLVQTLIEQPGWFCVGFEPFCVQPKW